MNLTNHFFQCQWNECSFISNNFDDLQQHLSSINSHTISNTNNNNNSNESDLNSVNIFYENIDYSYFHFNNNNNNNDIWSTGEKKKKNNENSEKFICFWCNCRDELETKEALLSHLQIHLLHYKWKLVGGAYVRNYNEKRLESIVCLNDSVNLNNISQFTYPQRFRCEWNECQFSTVFIILFFQHVNNFHVPTTTTKESRFLCKWKNCKLKSVEGKPSRIREHLHSHTKEKEMSCTNCGAIFSKGLKLIQHCQRSSLVKRFPCSVCSKLFASELLLADHFDRHIKKYRCSDCGFCTATKYNLRKHIIRKHCLQDKSEENIDKLRNFLKLFSCSQCDDRFFLCESDLNRHLLSHQPDDTRLFYCTMCKFSGKCETTVKIHYKKEHLNFEIRGYACHLCAVEKKTSNAFAKHLKNDHGIDYAQGVQRFQYRLYDDCYLRLLQINYEIPNPKSLSRKRLLEFEEEDDEEFVQDEISINLNLIGIDDEGK
ncbi:hypothetical protein SNEBB_008337, partial [Seison nebaliae]